MNDELLEVERLRKGEMDMYVIFRSSIWAQNFSPEDLAKFQDNLLVLMPELEQLYLLFLFLVFIIS